MNLAPTILRILRNMSGEPLSLPAIVDTVRLARPGLPESDIVSAVKSLEAGGYIAGTENRLLKTSLWTMTSKGDIAVAQL